MQIPDSVCFKWWENITIWIFQDIYLSSSTWIALSWKWWCRTLCFMGMTNKHGLYYECIVNSLIRLCLSPFSFCYLWWGALPGNLHATLMPYSIVYLGKSHNSLNISKLSDNIDETILANIDCNLPSYWSATNSLSHAIRLLILYVLYHM